MTVLEDLPCAEAVVVTGDLPLAWAGWLTVVATVVFAGVVVGGRWAGVLVMATRRPSGFVPYCTGWNNLKRPETHMRTFLQLTQGNRNKSNSSSSLG